MNIAKKVKAFITLDSKMIRLLVEALIYLGYARILLFFPFAKYASLLGHYMQETPELDMDQEKTKNKRKDISAAIHIMSRHTFWESKCLVRAIAGLKMLERRNIASTLYLGTTRESDTGKLIAHAWLRSGSYYITGAEGMDNFTVVGKFAKGISDERGKRWRMIRNSN